jgi:hypothetical protein
VRSPKIIKEPFPEIVTGKVASVEPIVSEAMGKRGVALVMVSEVLGRISTDAALEVEPGNSVEDCQSSGDCQFPLVALVHVCAWSGITAKTVAQSEKKERQNKRIVADEKEKNEGKYQDKIQNPRFSNS